MRILIIEDSVRLADTIADALRDENYIVDIANDGLQGYENAASGIYDMLILDLMLPKMNGYEVLSSLRKDGNDVPVLILSARTELDDKIQGFTVGADDYVTKPFSIPILLRKIAAILRRTQREDELQVISYKTLSVDVKGHHVYICKAEKGEQIEVELTQKEFEMLYVLLINKGIVLTRQKLLNMVWGEDYYGEERIVDTHIKNIRKKLGVNLISTIRGVGYRIDKEN